MVNARSLHGLEFGPVSLRVEFRDDDLKRDVYARLNLSTRVRMDATWTVTFERARSGSLGAQPYAMDVHRQGHRITVESPSVRGELDLDARCGTFHVWRRPRFGSQHFIENVLRIVTQHIAIENHSLLVHAAGVADPDDGTARVFAGPSGAGKSTIAGLLREQGGRVLSDDLVLLSTDADRAVVSATPFRGTLETPPSVVAPTCPIEAIHTLEKAPVARIGAPESPSRTAALILANTPFGETWDPATRTRALDVAARIAERVRVVPLAFPKDPQFACVFGGWLTRDRTSA